MCVTLYEVVYVYEAGSVCPHAPIRHLNSVSQSPVPPEWTVRHGHCGQQMGQPGGPWHLGPGLQLQPALGSAHNLNQHCVCSPLCQLVGMGVKAECLSVLQTPHWRRGILGMVLLSLSEFGKCGGHPYLWSRRWRALVESTLKEWPGLRLLAELGALGPSCSLLTGLEKLDWRHSQSAFSYSFLAGTSLVQHLMTILIRKHSQLFTSRTTEGPASPRGGPPCTVGWGSEEVTRDDQAEPGSPSAPCLPSHRTSSLDGAAVAALSRTSPTGLGSRCSPAATSPGKKVQTLPNWRSSFRQSGSRSGSPKVGTSSLEVPILSSGGNWLMNGLSSLRGHRRASSGDRLKDSGSEQRLSTYDNVPPQSSFPSTPSVASLPWSGVSSCEASARGSVSSCTACRASGSSACSSLHVEGALEPSPVLSSSEERRSLDQDHGLDGVGACVSSSEPSDPGSPAQDHARRTEVLQGLVTELRAELCRQRTEYETSVKR